jgi:hypothetical protein
MSIRVSEINYINVIMEVVKNNVHFLLAIKKHADEKITMIDNEAISSSAPATTCTQNHWTYRLCLINISGLLFMIRNLQS